MTDPRQRPRVLILVYSRLAIDARVLRQVRWLSQRYDVTSAAFGPSPVDGVRHVELKELAPYVGGWLGRLIYAGLLLLGMFSWVTAWNPRDRAALATLGSQEWDVIIANDVNSLPVATRLRARYGILADLHEYAPRQDETLIFRFTVARYFRWILQRWLGRVERVTTVSQGIADEYAREFGVSPVIVANAAAFHEREPRPVGAPIRIVHSAAPSPARRIEVMIEAVRQTSANVTFDLYLVDDGSSYMRKLRELARGIDRVTIHDPVPNFQLVDVLGDYDIGVHVLPPINFNHRWALPNKIFDYVQARLGILIGPSPEMQRVIEEYCLGAVAGGFSAESLAQLLDGLEPRVVDEWKHASHRAARELSGESQLERFEAVVQEMLTGDGGFTRAARKPGTRAR